MGWGGGRIKVQSRLCSQEDVKGLLRGLFLRVSVRSAGKVGLCLCESFLVREMSFTLQHSDSSSAASGHVTAL